jgi:hypothetical protein
MYIESMRASHTYAIATYSSNSAPEMKKVRLPCISFVVLARISKGLSFFLIALL